MNVYRLLFSQWMLHQKRSGAFRLLLITRLSSLMFILSALVFISWVAQKTLPGIDRSQMLQKSLLPFLIIDLLLRFLWARQPGLPSMAYLLLNIPKEKLINFCCMLSLLVRLNIITPVTFAALFSLSSLSITPVLALTGIMLTALSATFDFVVKLIAQRWSLLSMVYPVLLCFLLYASTAWFMQGVIMIGNLILSSAGQLLLLLLAVSLFLWQRRLLRITWERWLVRVVGDVLWSGSISFGKGQLLNHLALKWKLIFRNSRLRGMFFAGFVFSAYIYFGLQDLYMASNAYILFVALSLLLGHSAIFGIHVFSWFTKSTDFLFIRPLNWTMFMSASGIILLLFQLAPFIVLVMAGWGHWLLLEKISLLVVFVAGFPPLLNLFLSLFAARKTDIAFNAWWVKFRSFSWFNLLPELITGLIAALSLLATGVQRKDDLVFRVLGGIGMVCLLVRPRAIALMARGVESRKHQLIQQLKN